ncbi:MAG: MBL fold metallo-hydrolase [Gaiellales bacterium]|nr:MAG: MBL fold metallo-hydrolase [Gaiellales bacterium]
MGLGLITSPVGPLQGNCYTIYDDESREGIVIDPGEDGMIINEVISRNGIRVAAILLTHGHSDHLGAAAEVASATGAAIHGSAEARAVLSDPDSYVLFPGMPEFDAADVGVVLAGGEKLDFGPVSVEVIATPGHTPGSLTYHAYGGLFCGDLLFSGSVGRTDLPGGSFEELAASVKKLMMRFPDDTIVYPGHGNATTIGGEKQGNPFLADLGW